jgi:hypothetical protein
MLPEPMMATGHRWAAELVRRFAAERDWPVDYRRLPSTSPAHVMTPGARLAAWQAISQS